MEPTIPAAIPVWRSAIEPVDDVLSLKLLLQPGSDVFAPGWSGASVCRNVRKRIFKRM